MNYQLLRKFNRNHLFQIYSYFLLLGLTDGATCPIARNRFNMAVRWILVRTNEPVVLSKSRRVWLLLARAAKINSRQLPTLSPPFFDAAAFCKTYLKNYEFFLVFFTVASIFFFPPQKSLISPLLSAGIHKTSGKRRRFVLQ